MSEAPLERELREAVRRHERTVLAPRARAALPANHAHALEELMHVSHAVGGQTRFVQAGGGNTSVKAADGTLMFIKASGTPLAEMDARRGWVLVETGTLRELFDKRELLSKPASAREAEVARILGRSVVAPAEARPSVEAPLHALLGRVVIHTHPPAVNALTCNKRSRELLEKLWRKDEEQPLWVPYTDPGVMLAFRVRELIEKYRRRHGRLPRIILLENHGLICSADRATEALQLHLSVIDRIERSFSKAAMQARRFAFPQPAMDARAHAAVFTGALTPDHVVYAGPKPCVVEEPVYEARLSAAIKRYRKDEGTLPRVISLGEQGTWVVAENEKKLAAAQELFASAVASSLLAGGDLKPLGPAEVSFIMNWEAEHYRAKVMEKPSPALSTRDH